jgi:hypothetical protein
VFVTGLAIDYYSIFWDGWRGFVEEMDCCHVENVMKNYIPI